MMTLKVMYGLRFVGSYELLGLEVSYNKGVEFCNSVEWWLCRHSDTPYLVNTKEEAEMTLRGGATWYSSIPAYPTHSFAPDKLEVVKVTLVF